MLLPFTDGLMISNRADPECAAMADKHYSRRTIGSDQFTGPGTDMVLRNWDCTVLFVWVWHNADGTQLERWDKQQGYCCSLFRNESTRRASEIILEAEQIVRDQWGPNRVYTYVDATKIRRSRTPGHCFKKAGWAHVGFSKNGLWLFDKPAARLGVSMPTHVQAILCPWHHEQTPSCFVHPSGKVVCAGCGREATLDELKAALLLAGRTDEANTLQT